MSFRRILYGILAVELLDELFCGFHEAAWPQVRDDLGLSYTQIGLLMTVPSLVALLIEPAIGIYGDTTWRRALIRGGGVFFALAAALTALSSGFWSLLGATVLFYPAGGAFVGLSQASLMDLQPERREQNMARWSFAGAAGQSLGPLLLGASLWAGLRWREVYWLLALLAVGALAATWRQPHARPGAEHAATVPPATAAREALRSLRDRRIVSCLVLLETADLMLDVLLSYLALYLVDVAGASPGQAAVGVAVWTGVGVVGDLLLIPMLERVRGTAYLRASAAAALVVYPLFLWAEDWTVKLVLLGLLGLGNAGWYAILAARLYSLLPGRSGSAMAIGSAAGLVKSFIPLALGAAAQRFGLGAVMWVLLLAPISLLIGVRREVR